METIEVNGRQFGVRVERDEFMGEPWKEHDGHGIVSEWTTRPKRPGERILIQNRDSRRYYDVAATLAIAKREGWGTAGTEGLTGKAKAAKAVDADFEFIRGWCADEWEWVVVEVWPIDEHRKRTGESQYLGGVESLGDYWLEVATELARDIIANEDYEAAEAAYARSLGVPTLTVGVAL